MLWIRNAQIYAPESLGQKDLLIGGTRIEKILDSHKEQSSVWDIIDAKGKTVTPGFIDRHIHIIGGGGEGGFDTQAPPVKMSSLLQGSLTTVVGLLGTDGITRSIENLLARTKALRQKGLSVYCLSGSYGYPGPTLTGSVQKDVMFVDEILGCKLAISDHRAPHVTKEELVRLASDLRVAGMLSGKSDFLTLHLGDELAGLDLIMDILDTTSIPIQMFHPTHINRNPHLQKQAFAFAKRQGTIDLTCTSLEEVSQSLHQAYDQQVPWDKITLSSDGQGSWSKYDEYGRLLKIGVSKVDSIYQQVVYELKHTRWTMDQILPLATSNVSKALGLYPQKGVIQEGSDADLLIWNEDLTLDMVIAQGKVLYHQGRCIPNDLYDE